MAEEATQAVAALKAPSEDEQWLQAELLGKTVRVTLSDERMVIGKVACIDDLGNLVLYESEEFIPGLALSRFLSSIIVPDKVMTKLEVQLPS